MGAYTFDQSYPFSIRSMTPFPLGTLPYYSQDNVRKVVFPGGMVVGDESIFVAWGKGDQQIYVTTFDKKKLLDSMVPRDYTRSTSMAPKKTEFKSMKIRTKNRG